MKRTLSHPFESGARAALLLLAGGAAIVPAPAAPAAGLRCDPGSKVVREIRQVAEGIIEADNARDLERVLGYYAADAVLMPPGEPPVKGAEAIRPRYEKLFAGFDPDIETEIIEVCAEDRLAVVRGHNGGRLVSRLDGTGRVLDDAYLMVLRREAGEVWRISHLIWHRAGTEAGP